MGETTPLLSCENFLLDETFKTKEKKTLFERVLTSCNTKWFKTSWWGILLYVGICCLNYIIGYYGIYPIPTTADGTILLCYSRLVMAAW